MSESAPPKLNVSARGFTIKGWGPNWWGVAGLGFLVYIVVTGGWAGVRAAGALIGVLVVLGVILPCLLVIVSARHRHPHESWRAFYRRFWQDQRDNEVLRQTSWVTKWESPRRDDWLNSIAGSGKIFVRLDCGHVLVTSIMPATPQVGETAWCAYHRSLGPAEQHQILEVGKYLPHGKLLTIMGVQKEIRCGRDTTGIVAL